MDDPADARIYDWSIGCQMRTVLDFKKDDGAVRPDQSDCRPGPGWVMLTCVHPAGGNDGGGDDRFWSAFTSTSEAERL